MNSGILSLTYTRMYAHTHEGCGGFLGVWSEGNPEFSSAQVSFKELVMSRQFDLSL